jgi:hypothetical protein
VIIQQIIKTTRRDFDKMRLPVLALQVREMEMHGKVSGRVGLDTVEAPEQQAFLARRRIKHIRSGYNAEFSRGSPLFRPFPGFSEPA